MGIWISIMHQANVPRRKRGGRSRKGGRNDRRKHRLCGSWSLGSVWSFEENLVPVGLHFQPVLCLCTRSIVTGFELLLGRPGRRKGVESKLPDGATLVCLGRWSSVMLPTLSCTLNSPSKSWVLCFHTQTAGSFD